MMKLKKIFMDDSNILKELSKIQFDSEKQMQAVIERNLHHIFENLKFLKTEHSVNNLRPDTIGFDVEKKCFVIVEYKNVENKQVLDQGATYYRMLMSQKANFVLLYNQIEGEQKKESDFNWDETYLIFIASKFTKFQIGASGIGLPIQLYRISYYERGIILLEKIEDHLKNKLIKTNDSDGSVGLKDYIEEKYLDGSYGTGNSSDDTKKLYFEIKKKLLDDYDKLEMNIRKAYVGFYVKNDDSCICTLDVKKSAIMLAYSITVKKGILSESDFIENVEKKGIWGVGHYRSTIKNFSDFEKALPYIEKVYDHKTSS